ncbi:MAG: T9SS type A sorting domain-containing protein [Bacteroidales bacterium]|nr:T9SS type A sorting domain-containing protein [Bacteroidales bacterium]
MDCEQPVGLGVMGADADSIVLSWDSSGAPLWDVLLWADGVEPDSGMLFSVERNRLTLHGLDTAQRYNVKVRAVCDTLHINTSPWSSVFGFRVSDYIVRPCPVPEGLRVQPMAAAGSVVARWNNSEVGLWELALWSDGGGDTTTLQSAVEYLDVDGLDTARWYSAMVRAWCDSTNISEWSDTVRFFVPNPNPGGTDPIGIETAIDRNIGLVPNPTDGKVTVLSSHLLRRVELFGSDGKLIAAFDADGHSATLDLGSCPAGTYIVRVTTSAGVTNKRLVKR